jgi:hypothetical protein
MRRPATKCHDAKCELSSTRPDGEVVAILFVGIDLAKNVFAIHGVDELGKAMRYGHRYRSPVAAGRPYEKRSLNEA